METIAGWIASIATVVAAIMTAANLGARVTGWGFVVFFVGSISWTIVGASTGQTSLLATNGFLALVNMIGAWRWLGRRRSYEDGGRSAAAASRRSAAPTLFTATSIAGLPVDDRDGVSLGKVVEALVECKSGCLSYVVVATGGLGGIEEQLRAIDWDQVGVEDGHLRLTCSKQKFVRLPVLKKDEWPVRPTRIERASA